MPFLDHLEELRWRILKSLIAVVVGTAIGWLVVQNVDVIEILKRPIAPHLPGGRLVFTSPTEPFLLTLKVAFAMGVLLASPAVIYQVWAFLAPALYTRERRVIVPALSVGVVLFAAGAAAAYRYALPAALDVLFSFQRADLSAVITIDKYFGFALPFILAFGLITELPLVVVILASLGVVTPGFLSRNRRYAIVIAAFTAALLTPPDALSMIMMMVPLLLLYEISIFAAWIVVRRQARRRAADAAGAVLLLLFALGGAPALIAQDPPVRPVRPVRPDTTRRLPPPPRPPGMPPARADSGQAIDTALARKIGLPTGPTRSFPATDPVIDSLLKLQGYQVTRYVAETLLVEGDSGTIYLRGEAFLEREGTQLEADSVKYRESACRLDASGDPRLFDQSNVLVGEGMRYDTCIKRGTVNDAFTDFEQGGATWYMRGNIAVDSGSTRLYGATSKFTSDERPEPDYHFLAGQVKWINKNVMVARPAVLYVRDVPIMWLPFIFKDIRSGRRSGVLVPGFGLTDLVRTSRGYQRHVLNVGYYFAINNYVDLEVAADWYAGRNYTLRARTQYKWLDRFITGGLSFGRVAQTDASAATTTFAWNHQQRFDSRTSFNASINYATSGRVIQRNSLDPYYATATMNSGLNFEKRFGWGSLTVGGNRKQDLATDQVSMNFPEVRLTPAAVSVGTWLTWSPQFSYTNNQTFHNRGTSLLVPGDSLPDTAAVFFDDRRTSIAFNTPLRVGRWNWNNSVAVQDVVSDKREEFVFDSAAPGGARRVVFSRTFETRVDWQTGINLPSLFSGTWKLQPGIAILNATSAGPFMIRNQFSGGEFVRQGKRLAFNASISPAFFGFFPGVGPLERIRHSFTPLVSYQYAPGAKVPDEFARVLDPTGKNPNARTDPQQTISLGISQNFEGKVRREGSDTASDQPARKFRLLSINTSGVSYNFEQAKQPGRTGWTTQTMNNTFASELLPGFSLGLNHDLWEGAVGFDTTRFDPFLQSVTAGFSITPATLAGLASLVGLGGHRPPAPAATAPTPENPVGPSPSQVGGPLLGPGVGRYGSPGGGGGRAFSLSASYSSTRVRGDTTQGPIPGRRQLNMTLNFSPTAKWTASWDTAYDLETGRFGRHFLRFERDLYRWHASFAFVRSPNGNLSFNFNIALLDQPEIKFDYDQQTYSRP